MPVERDANRNWQVLSMRRVSQREAGKATMSSRQSPESTDFWETVGPNAIRRRFSVPQLGSVLIIASASLQISRLSTESPPHAQTSPETVCGHRVGGRKVDATPLDRLLSLAGGGEGTGG